MCGYICIVKIIAGLDRVLTGKTPCTPIYTYGRLCISETYQAHLPALFHMIVHSWY